MRTSTLRVLLGLALLLAARPTLAGVSYGGNLGLSLSRSDQWGANDRSGNTLWWFSGGLHLDASFFTRGTLDIGAAASYLGYRAVGGSASDALNYTLQLSALARTPVNLSASAGRTTVDFTSDRNSGRVGSTVADSLGGTAILNVASYPFLAANVRNSSTTNRSVGAPEVRTNVTTLAAEASQSLQSLNYTLSYGTGWSSGDYAETNYQDHGAGLRAQAQLAYNVTTQVTATYNLREPTLTSPLNPRLDNQTLSTWLQWAASSDTSGGGGYSYANSLFEAPGSPLRQSISHSLNAYGSHRLSEEYAFDLSAGAAAAQTRLGATEEQGTGEQVGGGVRWGRQLAQYAALATLSANLGLYQPAGAPSATTWGVGASFNASRPLDTWYGSAGLSGSRDENSGASAGSRTRLYGVLSASGSPLGWSLTSLLSGGFSRSESPAFGKTDQSNVRLEVQANRGGYNLGLNAGLTDDLSELLVLGGPPASPLIPVDFNTQTRFAVATATVPAVPRLFLTFVGRHVSISAPGRSDQWETGFSVTAAYHLGAFSLSLHDQVTIAGSSSGSSGTQNVLFLSLSRSFGR